MSDRLREIRERVQQSAPTWPGSYAADCAWLVAQLDEARHCIDERNMARAEVEMLRGVGCDEDGDGPCGACLKCARRERDELRAALEAIATDLIRQVEEFETWDQDDWPAALHVLKKQADAARSALSRSSK